MNASQCITMHHNASQCITMHHNTPLPIYDKFFLFIIFFIITAKNTIVNNKKLFSKCLTFASFANKWWFFNYIVFLIYNVFFITWINKFKTNLLYWKVSLILETGLDWNILTIALLNLVMPTPFHKTELPI